MLCMVPCETKIIAEQDAVIFWRNKLPWQQESLAKTPHILALKNEIGDPKFLLHKSDQEAKMKICKV